MSSFCTSHFFTFKNNKKYRRGYMYQYIHMYVQETKTAIGLESDKYIKVQSAL